MIYSILSMRKLRKVVSNMRHIISQLKSNMRYLSKTERKIARLIVDSPLEFSEYTMTELASIADVSHGSIINFSKKFAGGGYPELKNIVATSVKMAELGTDNGGSGTISDELANTIKNNTDAYQLTSEINSEEVIKAVADKIRSAKKVEIYGVYRSAAVATDFYYQLIEVGIPASFVSDILTCAVSAAMLDRESLVVAISSSGKTKDILDAVKNAKENDVPVVCLTSNKNSPLARMSDYPLIASSCGNGLSGREMEIRSSQLLLTDVICSYLRHGMDAEGQKKYLRLKEILNSHSVND